MTRVGREARGGDNGFGLVEVMISLAVLLTVLVASSYLVDNVVQQAATNREKVSATELAEQYLETVSNDSLATLESYISRDTLLTASPVTVGGIKFTVWAHLEWATTGFETSPCASGNPPEVIRATITVKWFNTQSLAETAIVNPPYGIDIPGDGYLSIQINGEGGTNSPPADKASLVNVQVEVTPGGGSMTVYNPDQYGCVYLEEPAGASDTYTVALASPSGGPTFITSQEVTSPAATAQTVTVKTAGLVYPATFRYDEAGTVNWSPAGSAPAATGMPVSILNGGNLTGGTLVVNAPGAGATSDLLFPYSSPYSIWYGDCAPVAGVIQEEPATPTTFSITQQGTSAASITGLYSLSIQATRAAGFTSGKQPNSASALVADPNQTTDGCPAADKAGASGEESYGLAGFAPSPTGSTTSYLSQTDILPQTYSITIPYNATNFTFTVAWNASGGCWQDGATCYTPATVIPVTLP